MATPRRHRHFLLMLTASAAFTFLLFISDSSTPLSPVGKRGPFNSLNPTKPSVLFHVSKFAPRPSLMTSYAGNGVQEMGKRETGNELLAFDPVLTQKRRDGPGSSPPTCRSKCGRCSPCKPVHVPIQPDLSMPLEYYPEAWRCKCGNKLFMP